MPSLLEHGISVPTDLIGILTRVSVQKRNIS